ncbi:MAG: type II secretion system protein [Candidatus Amesbacteria bacterium]|nr:type II secretion system protein [Candidatus Amesbacteria bacterium]
MTKGFTLIEMIVVIGIGLVILTTTTVLLLGGQRRVVKISAEEQILSDIRSVQTKAMSGLGAQSISFANNSYTTDNYVVNLDNNIQLTTTFAGSSIVFLAVSGEINNYVSGSDTVSITDATDDTKRVIHFNKYGVPILEN